MASGKKTDKFSSFAYIATNPTTGVVRGELRAAGQDSALIQLERMGLEPISVSEKKTVPSGYGDQSFRESSSCRDL